MVGREWIRGLALILVVTALGSLALSAIGVPSPVLFAALAAGLVQALTSRTPLRVPTPAFRVAQGLLGVTIGAQVSAEALAEMGGDAFTIALVTAGTIVLSLLAGRLLAVRRDVTPVTGAFAMIAGGASGVIAIARDLGADDRVVAVVQYLRVLVVLLVMPAVTTLVFRPETGLGSLPEGGASLATDLAYVAGALAIGLLATRWIPLPTVALLGPLLVAAVVAAGGWLGEVSVPVPLQWVAYAVIGVQVGLRFTRDSLVTIARMLPVVLLIILGLIVATAAMGWLLAALTPVDPLTAYLATTPGGLFAVLVIATDSGSDVTYVMAVQLVRLLAIIALAPLIARWVRRSGARHTTD